MKGSDGCGQKDYLAEYEQVCRDFRWSEVAEELHLGQKYNIAIEAVDHRAVGRRKQKAAFRFCNGNTEITVSYEELKNLTNKFANLLQGLKVRPGARVAVFLPPVPEFYVAFLGAVKAGAVAVPLSTALMSDALTEILEDSEASVVITSGILNQRIKRDKLPSLRHVILVDRGSPAGAGSQAEISFTETIDYAESMAAASSAYAAQEYDPEDPMMLLYTSGSTGKPKGVIHVHSGILHFYQTGKLVLDLQPQDIYWCTSDPGWVPGISYGIWAPLLNGITSVIYAGEFNADKWYEVLAKLRVNIWYTTPTALRHLMNFGPDNPAKRYSLKSLRHIMTVGEPLNPMVIRWSAQAFGLTVHDTWWMTETGGQIICNLRCLPLKPGSMGRTIPGIEATVIDEQGRELQPLEVGQLALKAGWPGMMRGIWKDEEKYREYFRWGTWYVTGDLAYRDAEGYFWFQGRVDDVIKKGSERIGPFEVENKLAEHPAVMEAGVIGKPDPLWGEIIKAFVVLHPGFAWSKNLEAELQEFIQERLGPHLVPWEIEARGGLPRTRSGKIMRRALKALELGLPSANLGEEE